MDWFQPQKLEGKYVQLELLEPSHYPLILAALEPDIFTYMNLDPLCNPEALKTGRIDLNSSDSPFKRMPLVIYNLSNDNIAGSTSFYVIRKNSRTIEIGGTWVKKVYQGTHVNTETKYLMFKHAFEVWQVIRVQLRTHNLNEQSKRAIEKLGAIKEGVVRHDSVFHDGTYRDTALYSVINTEWQLIKRNLQKRLYAF